MDNDPFTFKVQQTRQLYVKQLDNCWAVWLTGNPKTIDHTTLRLYADGSIEMWTHHGDDVQIKRVKGT